MQTHNQTHDFPNITHVRTYTHTHTHSQQAQAEYASWCHCSLYPLHLLCHSVPSTRLCAGQCKSPSSLPLRKQCPLSLSALSIFTALSLQFSCHTMYVKTVMITRREWTMTNNLGDFTKGVMGVIRRKYENIVLSLCKLLLHLCLCVWALVSLLGKLHM